MVVEIGVFGEFREIPFVFGFDVNRRSHVFAVALIGLDADSMEFIFRSFDGFFKISTAFLAFRGIITEGIHDFSDAGVIFFEEAEGVPDGEMVAQTVVRFFDNSSSNGLTLVGVGLQERRMCEA